MIETEIRVPLEAIDAKVDPLLAQMGDWPEKVLLVWCARIDKYGCYQWEGVNGLACFDDPEVVALYREDGWTNFPGESTEIIERTFQEARQIAKDRPPEGNVVCLLFLDPVYKRGERPLIHYIR
jgi:hypothetical protein